MTINGWGISNAQRQPLSYKLSVNQAPFFQALQFERPEVNEAEQLPAGTKAGFELQIRCEREKSFLIEAVAENGESWFIEI